MSEHPLDRALDALDERGLRCRRIGDEAVAQCPAHEDRNPSLSLRYDDGEDGKDLGPCCGQPGEAAPG